MELTQLSKLLILVGLGVVAIGVIVYAIGRVPFLGNLPGDIRIQRDDFSFYAPITSCIVVSVVISLLMWLFSRK